MLALLGLAAATAEAAPRCALPGPLGTPHEEGPTATDPQRILPIGSYTLSLIWMPQQCASGHDIDCRLYRQSLAHGGRRDGFALHGLWPDGEGKAWPQYCRPAAQLPATLIADHVCATPSPQLLQHEWAKHGTCMDGYDPERYFALSTRLAAAVRMPRLARLARRPQTAASLGRAIAAANRGMTGDMMRFYLDGNGWLQEVWFCFDTAFKPEVCPATRGGARGETPVLIRTGA